MAIRHNDLRRRLLIRYPHNTRRSDRRFALIAQKPQPLPSPFLSLLVTPSPTKTKTTTTTAAVAAVNNGSRNRWRGCRQRQRQCFWKLQAVAPCGRFGNGAVGGDEARPRGQGGCPGCSRGVWHRRAVLLFSLFFRWFLFVLMLVSARVASMGACRPPAKARFRETRGQNSPTVNIPTGEGMSVFCQLLCAEATPHNIFPPRQR